MSLRLDKSSRLEESTCSTCHQLLMCCVQLLPWLARRWFSSKPRSPLPSTLTQSYHIKAGDKWPLRSWLIITPHHNTSQRLMTAQNILFQPGLWCMPALLTANWRWVLDASACCAIRDFPGREVRSLGHDNAEITGKGWMEVCFVSDTCLILSCTPKHPNQIYIRRCCTHTLV